MCQFGLGVSNVLSFNSLSKRSSAPGLRSGFISLGPKIIKRYGQFVTLVVPFPTYFAYFDSALGDDTHVAENRDYYNKNFELAAEILGATLT